MDISKLVSLNPEDAKDKEQFKKEFWRLVEENGFKKVLCEIIKQAMKGSEGRKAIADFRRDGISDDDIANIFTESAKEGLQKLLY